jgi:hypothetical protein
MLLRSAKSLNGTHAAGYATIKLSGTMIVFPLTRMVPPLLNASDLTVTLEDHQFSTRNVRVNMRPTHLGPHLLLTELGGNRQHGQTR